MVVAPSGAGKSSLVAALLKDDPSLSLSISCTTRAPRPGEQPGREYHFLSLAEFIELRENKGLVEWAEVHGNCYGTPRTWIEAQLLEGRDVVLEIDWQGARQIRQLYPFAVSVFILPPSIQTLESRLKQRGQDAPDVIAHRLLAAGGEIAHAPECDYVIINQEFSLALQALITVVSASRLRFRCQVARHASLFSQLGLSNTQ